MQGRDWVEIIPPDTSFLGPYALAVHKSISLRTVKDLGEE